MQKSIIQVGHEAYENYQKTGNFVFLDNMTSNDFAVWQIISKEDLPAYKIVTLESLKREIDKSLSDFKQIDNGQEAFLRIIASLGSVWVNNYSPHQVFIKEWKELYQELSQEIYDTWIKRIDNSYFTEQMNSNLKRLYPDVYTTLTLL